MTRRPLLSVALLVALASGVEPVLLPVQAVTPKAQEPHPADALPLPFRDCERLRAAEENRARRAAKRRGR